MSNDNAKRKIDYLRISVTDRCNLRCAYCMPPEGIETVKSEELLSFEEILRLVRIFASLNIKKVRITGGEPLLRKEVTGLVRDIANIRGIEEITLTTNGVRLAEYAKGLKAAGVERLNISLDTLREDKFMRITGNPFFRRVMDGIEKARAADFGLLKLNTVIMKGINEDEIIDFIEFARAKNLILRFLEFMKVAPLWNKDLFVPIDEIKKICGKKYTLEQMKSPGPGPAEHYMVDGMPILGFIKTDQKNCGKCSRLRLTSQGEVKICLYENRGLFLKEPLRKGADDREIRDMIIERMGLKKEVSYRDWTSPKTYMCSLGG